MAFSKIQAATLFLFCIAIVVQTAALLKSLVVLPESLSTITNSSNTARDATVDCSVIHAAASEKKIETSATQSDQNTISVSPTTPKLIPNQCDAQARNQKFENIYLNGRWGSKLLSPSDFYGDAHWPPSPVRRMSASGGGSELGHASETSLKIIKDVIAKYNVTSMVDIPCGDANWIFDSFETDSLPLYVGLDIVRPVIEVNKQRFAHHKNKQFLFWDAISCTLPKFQNGTRVDEHQPFDLVHVRDVIQHMNPRQGVQYFCNVFKSEAKILITTTFPGGFNRPNVREGGAYKNDLEAEPFSFPKSGSCTPTHPGHESDNTCVYDLSEAWVKEFIANKCK